MTRLVSLLLLLAATAPKLCDGQLLTALSITPCLNNTLVPAFSPSHYLYTAMEADPTTASAHHTACTPG